MQLPKAEVAIHGRVDGVQEFTMTRASGVWTVVVEGPEPECGGQTTMTDEEAAATLACFITGATFTDKVLEKSIYDMARPAADRLADASLIP